MVSLEILEHLLVGCVIPDQMPCGSSYSHIEKYAMPWLIVVIPPFFMKKLLLLYIKTLRLKQL